MHVLDVDKLLEAFEFDRELVSDLTDIFLGDLPSQVGKIQAAIDASDAVALRATAHAVKGASSNFRVEKVTSKALELEMLGRSGTTGGADRVFGELKALLALLEEDLRAFRGA